MELSFRTMRSSSTPPNIMAPNRPLPMGEEDVKSLAGASNQIVVSGGPGRSGADHAKVAANNEMPATRQTAVTVLRESNSMLFRGQSHFIQQIFNASGNLGGLQRYAMLIEMYIIAMIFRMPLGKRV